ncbi:STM4012 family radical SAM protein [Rubellicoccus peritrichatus]|uniref:STM4012 family radical SAM protein n=1 Tax=Rubellicoccus peritrichatus TaxID=3080537 RepID=A0AAQ3QPR3_9BACT|nr:STM4012 family radical SAM protein [Puniceicoccus sp. CR14]WOO39353.1 STM4012 family radical SAM protein [Puniceicoccus sp. CR14]
MERPMVKMVSMGIAFHMIPCGQSLMQMEYWSKMTLAEQFYANPYVGYTYAYPHKTAYRKFDVPLSLCDVWAVENQQNLFLYIHIPFCEMRCGFCNLFTTTNPDETVIDHYLTQLEIEIEEMSKTLCPEHRFVRGAFGGGTPSILNPQQLDRLLACLFDKLNFSEQIALSFEVSPHTVTSEKLDMLKQHGIERVSIGVQSFYAHEVKEMGRPQKQDALEKALSLIDSYKFPVFNIDLIYGASQQTVESFKQSIKRALDFGANEIYLYPLYVRPLTGLERLGRKADNRLTLYRAGRDELRKKGFEQVSMRLFRNHDHAKGSLEYCCQEDGMVGLGIGARSYTHHIHYSSEYAVGRNSIKAIIDEYLSKQAKDFREIAYGFQLNDEEQSRRYIIKSLLRTEGLDLHAYEEVFSRNAIDQHKQLQELCRVGLAEATDGMLNLNDKGLELSDAIGPWLFSEVAAEKMKTYQLA